MTCDFALIRNRRALKAIAALRPTSRTALAGVPGIGAAKLDRFGDDLIALVCDD